MGIAGLLVAGWALLFPALFPASAKSAWLPASSLTQTGSDALNPDVAFGPDGTTTVVWQRSTGPDEIVQVATRKAGSDSFTTPVDVSLPGQDAETPRVVTGPDGTTTIVWYRSNGTNTIIQAVTRSPGMTSFSAPVDLSLPGGNAYYPIPAVGPDGSTTVLWARNQGANETVQTATRPAGSASFAAPVDVLQLNSTISPTEILIAPNGETTVLWYRAVGASYLIQAATRAGGSTTFSAPVDVSTPGVNSQYPRGSVGPDGSITVVWQQGSGGLDTIGSSFRAAGTSTFSAPTTLSQGGVYNRQPAITAGPDGTTTAAWYSYDGTRATIQAASRAAGAASFGTPTTISTGNTNAYNPDLTTSFDGTTTAAWYQFDGLGGSLIQAANRVAGAPSFGQPTALSASSGSAYDPTVASGPCGSYTTAVWERSDGVDYLVQQASEPTAVCRPSLAKLRVRGPKKARLNRKVVFRITAANSGTATATGLRLRASGRGVKASKTVGKLAAGKSKTVKLPVRFRKQGKVRVTFTLASNNAGKKTVKKSVRVR